MVLGRLNVDKLWLKVFKGSYTFQVLWVSEITQSCHKQVIALGNFLIHRCLRGKPVRIRGSKSD